MRERTRFEAEINGLNSISDQGESFATYSYPRELAVFEKGGTGIDPKLEPYRVLKGKYTPRQKLFHAQHPKGLLRTATVVGREEQRLVGQAPFSIFVSKELMRFKSGRLGAFVMDYNEFTHYFEEILRGLGRLRDLLAVGSPEAPTDLTTMQKHALRPTDDTKASSEKKQAYPRWREAQAKYAVFKDGLHLGLVFDVPKTDRDLNYARQEFWEAKEKLGRSIAEGKKLKKPGFEALDLKFSDAVSLAMSGGGWGTLAVGAGLLIDTVLSAREKRKEYDAKVKDFEDLIKRTNQTLIGEFEAFKREGNKYWDRDLDFRTALRDRNEARVNSRKLAAVFAQTTLSAGEKRARILGEARMPQQIADAWHVLATIGPRALAKLKSVVKERELVGEAILHHQRPDPLGISDITNIKMAINRADSWSGVLTNEEVEEWVAMNRLWEEVWTKFFV